MKKSMIVLALICVLVHAAAAQPSGTEFYVGYGLFTVQDYVEVMGKSVAVALGNAIGSGIVEAIAGPGREPSDCAMSRELRAAIEEAVQSLPPDMRELVILRDMEQRSYEEICAVADVPLGTVKSRIHRGRLLLREKLARYL